MTILETIIYVLLYLLIGTFTLLLCYLISNLIKYIILKIKIHKYNTILKNNKSDKKNK